MSPQIETKTNVTFKTGIKDYKLTYYTSNYEIKDINILAIFRVTLQPRVSPEEAGVVVADESSIDIYGQLCLLTLIVTRNDATTLSSSLNSMCCSKLKSRLKKKKL